MVNDTAHWKGIGNIQPQGGLKSDRGLTLESMERCMGLSSDVGRYGRGSITGIGDLCLLPPEHSRTVY